MKIQLYQNIRHCTKNETASVTFTEEVLNGKLHFLCSVNDTLLLYSEFTFINLFDSLRFQFGKLLNLFNENPRATCLVNSVKQIQDSNFVCKHLVLTILCGVLIHFMPLISFYPPKKTKNRGYRGVQKETSGMKWVNCIAKFFSEDSYVLVSASICILSTLSCILLLNGQTYFKNLAMFKPQDFENMFGHFTTLCMKGSKELL